MGVAYSGRQCFLRCDGVSCKARSPQESSFTLAVKAAKRRGWDCDEAEDHFLCYSCTRKHREAMAEQLV